MLALTQGHFWVHCNFAARLNGTRHGPEERKNERDGGREGGKYLTENALLGMVEPICNLSICEEA